MHAEHEVKPDQQDKMKLMHPKMPPLFCPFQLFWILLKAGVCVREYGRTMALIKTSDFKVVLLYVLLVSMGPF